MLLQMLFRISLMATHRYSIQRLLRQAQGAANLAVKFLKGEEVDPVNMVDYVKVTADNAQEILDKIK